MSNKKSIAVCCCSDRMIQGGSGYVQDTSGRLRDIELDVPRLRFSMAATMEESYPVIWRDPIELTKHLMQYDEIVTFNGEKFCFPLIANEVTRAMREGIQDPTEIVSTDEFFQTYTELKNRSYDLMVATKAATGSIVSLANLGLATLKVQRKHSLAIATAARHNNDLIAVVNFVLEAVGIIYNLHYVKEGMHQLSMAGPDDKVVMFDL